MRKDGKSQYQIKKEKLQEIKKLIKNYQESWEEIRIGKIRGNTKPQMVDAYELLAEIWEMVEDE